ncbi:MAG TPA: hypothetical protein PK762_11705 [Candidatus Kapabacteria bacterium]|nr:hypothetical protein [Candidatus Kapabacteria bacterium]
MNYNDLIHQFLDGELDSLKEDILFSNLSNNTEIREMFKQQVQLHLLTQNDMASITTPSESTNYIFSNLGLSVPPAEKPAPVAPIPPSLFEKHILSHYNKYLTTALTAIISVALTSMFFLLYQSDFTNSNINTASVIKQNQNNYNYPVSTNFETSAKNNDLASSNNSNESKNPNNDKQNIKYIYLNSNTQNNDNNSQIFAENQNQKDNSNIIKNSTEESFVLASSSIPNKNIKQNKLGSNNVNNNPLSIYTIDLNSLGQFQGNETNLTLQWRNITSRSGNVPENLPSAQEPLFINQGIALIYKLDDNNSFGIEIGQEHFLQQFVRKIGEQDYIYTQNPVLFWYGGFYKLSLPSIGYKNIIVPYAQVFAGGTTSGVIGRGQLGIQYNYDNFLKFYVAGELSSLFYNVQNKINRTDKFGITYGLSLSY